MNVPKIKSNHTPRSNSDLPGPQMAQTITLTDRYGCLNGDNEDNNVLHKPCPTPQTKKRARQLSPENIPKNKKPKTQLKKVSVPKKGKKETETSSWKTREIGTQTDLVFVEKIITPTKFKNINIIETNKDTTEETLDGIDFEDVDNVLQKLGKKVISIGNFTCIIKLLEALIKNLTKEQVDETELSSNLPSTGPDHHNP